MSIHTYVHTHIFTRYIRIYTYIPLYIPTNSYIYHALTNDLSAQVPGGVPSGRGRLEFAWGDVYSGEVVSGRPQVSTFFYFCEVTCTVAKVMCMVDKVMCMVDMRFHSFQSHFLSWATDSSWFASCVQLSGVPLCVMLSLCPCLYSSVYIYKYTYIHMCMYIHMQNK